MKIAIATEDETTISAHFGKAPVYVVMTIADGQVATQETRSKAICGSHDHDDGHHHEHNEHDEHDGQASEADSDGHHGQLDPIHDCQLVLSGGMCQGMFDNLHRVGIHPFMTSEKDIQVAVAAYLAGTLAAENTLVR